MKAIKKTANGYYIRAYSQSSAVHANGLTTYSGEDALPFSLPFTVFAEPKVTKRLPAAHSGNRTGSVMFAADGLGGAAAMRHKLFDRGILCGERIIDALFGGVYEDCGKGRFDDYVRRSFADITALGEHYFDGVEMMKKSGYFGSRLLGAVIFHQTVYGGELKRKAAEILRRAVHGGADRGSQDMLADAAQTCERVIRTELSAIAAKAGLKYESAFKGLALLGTTMCLTFAYKFNGKVYALYFTAGDSRPYVLTKAGFMQVLPDEERPDGGMSNYIRIDEGSSFHVRCNLFEFPAPCILINATDGCFDSSAFCSPMAFEKMLLGCIADSFDGEKLSLHGAGIKMQSVFDKIGRHDDSRSLVIRFFGLRDGRDIADFAKARLADLQLKYLSKMPGLLERDYIGELARLQADRQNRLKAARIYLWSLPAVRAHYLELSVQGSAEDAADIYRREWNIGREVADSLLRQGIIDEGQHAEAVRRMGDTSEEDAAALEGPAARQSEIFAEYDSVYNSLLPARSPGEEN